MNYFIQTFGCQHNVADSERIKQTYRLRNIKEVQRYQDADIVIINTCMVRESAENRIYGLFQNLKKVKESKRKYNYPYTIIVTGCIVGMAIRDKKQKMMSILKKRMPEVDEFMPIEEVGFEISPLRNSSDTALIPISNGCNNYCTFCVVPYTRGKETSRPYGDILSECLEAQKKGFKKILLLGQNVNSYGADLKTSKYNGGKKPIFVKHLGRFRIPTLFPHLLHDVAQLGFQTVDFISSNPWDFSDELIKTIKKNSNITRTIHLPVQSGDSEVLKRMNRWYTREEYIELIKKMRKTIPKVRITTDIIVGFCGETDKEFQNTVSLCKQVGFERAFIAQYSPRPLTYALKTLKDDVPHAVKEKRWKTLELLINKPYLQRLMKKRPLSDSPLKKI